MQNSPKILPARILLGVFFSIQKFHPSWPTQHFQMAIPRISWRPDWAWNSREVAGFDRPMGDSVRKSRGKSSRLLNWCTRPGKRLQFANWKITMLFDGKTHYFDWAIFNSYVSLPEGTSFQKSWQIIIKSSKIIKNIRLTTWQHHLSHQKHQKNIRNYNKIMILNSNVLDCQRVKNSSSNQDCNLMRGKLAWSSPWR